MSAKGLSQQPIIAICRKIQGGNRGRQKKQKKRNEPGGASVDEKTRKKDAPPHFPTGGHRNGAKKQPPPPGACIQLWLKASHVTRSTIEPATSAGDDSF